MKERGPWKLASLHIPSGECTERVIAIGHDVASSTAGRRYIQDRRGFLEFLAWCNAQQPGVWQYWERP